MNVAFGVEALAAFSPQSDPSQQWCTWHHGQTRIVNQAPASAAHIPAMLRRRLNAQGRMAAASTCAVTDGIGEHVFVFASRHGEIARSTSLIQDLNRGEPMSPTAFGLAVHNAVGGMLGIALHDRAACYAVAAGAETFVMGLLEAAALLATESDTVVYCYYDEPLPAPYSANFAEPHAPLALALRLRSTGASRLQLNPQTDAADPPARTPQAAAFLRFWADGDGAGTLPGAPHPWQLTRDVASH